MAEYQSACQLFNCYCEKLSNCLPMDDPEFLSKLKENNLITDEVNTTLRSHVSSKDKASYFLGAVIKPGMSSDSGNSFNTLLSIMKESNLPNVSKELATDIMAKLDYRQYDCELMIKSCNCYTNILS